MENPFDSYNDALERAIEKFRALEKMCRKVIEDKKLGEDWSAAWVRPRDFTQSLQDTAEALNHVEKAFRECRSKTKNFLRRERDAKPIPIITDLHVPMAFSPNDFLPLSLLSKDFFCDFYKCDLSDEQKKMEFIEKHKYAVEQYIGGIYAKQGDPAYEMLLAVQAELKTLIDAYQRDSQAFARPQQAADTDNPLRLLNKWLSRVDFQVRPYAIFPDKADQENYNRPRWIKVNDNGTQQEVNEEDADGLWWQTNHDFSDAEWCLVPTAQPRDLEPGQFWRNRYAVLFVQFVKVILSNRQELYRCPVCENPFMRGRRGPEPRACSNPACQSAVSRDPARYGFT